MLVASAVEAAVAAVAAVAAGEAEAEAELMTNVLKFGFLVNDGNGSAK